MQNLKRFFLDWLGHLGLFKFALLLSFFLHGSAILSYYMATLPSDESYVDSSNTEVDVDWQEIPPELLGGTSSPAPVEKSDWVEGTNQDKETNASDDTDVNPDRLSGEGTDKDGFLFSYNGDRPPTPIIDFDLQQFFPEAAKVANIPSRTVVVLVQVDEHGKLQGSKLVSGRAGFGFDEAALKVLRMIRFSPGLNKGKPTAMSHRMPITFNLEDE